MKAMGSLIRQRAGNRQRPTTEEGDKASGEQRSRRLHQPLRQSRRDIPRMKSCLAGNGGSSSPGALPRCIPARESRGPRLILEVLCEPSCRWARDVRGCGSKRDENTKAELWSGMWPMVVWSCEQRRVGDKVVGFQARVDGPRRAITQSGSETGKSRNTRRR